MWSFANVLVLAVIGAACKATAEPVLQGGQHGPPNRVGKIFTKPFKSTELIRQRCISPDVRGCSPNEATTEDGRVRHLLIAGDDGDIWMHFHEKGTVNTQSLPMDDGIQAAGAMTNIQDGMGSQEAASAAIVSGEPGETAPNAPNLDDAWKYQGIVVVNDVEYHNYTASYEDLVKPEEEGDNMDVYETKALVEIGLIPNFHEYLEDMNGNPYRVRDYSTPNEWKLYRETVFLAVVPLDNTEVEEYTAQQAHKEGEALRRKLSTKRDTTLRATKQVSLRGSAPIIPEEETGAPKHDRRLQSRLSGGIEVPRGCLNSNDDFPCFALHAYETDTTVDTRLRFTIGAKKKYKTQKFGKIKGTFGAVLDGKFVLEKATGKLKQLDASAHGCAEFAKRIGLLSAGVEFCMQGALKMIPQTSISGRIDMWASIFGEIKGLGRLSFKIAGGSVTADAVYLDGGYRLKEITAYIWRKQRFGPAYIGAGVRTRSRPHDTRRADNWQTDVYFNGFAGIDLWLWKDEVRFDIKIAQVGPEKRKAVAAPPPGLLSPEDKQDILDQEELEAERLAKAKASVTCNPECIVEISGKAYVAFRLPGGKADDAVSFPEFKYVEEKEPCGRSCSKGARRKKCTGFVWTDVEYTCTFNGKVESPSASWIRNGDYEARSWGQNQCVNDVSRYSSHRETVTDGAQFLSYGPVSWASQVGQSLVACGEVPKDADHIELKTVEYSAAEEPVVRFVRIPQDQILVAPASQVSSTIFNATPQDATQPNIDDICLYPFDGVACCSGLHEASSAPLEAEEVTTISLELPGAAINIISPPDSAFFVSTNDLMELGFPGDKELDLRVKDFAIGTSFFDAPYNPVSSGLSSSWTYPVENFQVDPHKNQYVSLERSYHELAYDYYWKAPAQLVMNDGSRHDIGELQGRISGSQLFPGLHAETKTCFWCNSTDSMCGIHDDMTGTSFAPANDGRDESSQVVVVDPTDTPVNPSSMAPSMIGNATSAPTE